MAFLTLARLFLETYFLFLTNILFWLVLLLAAFQYQRLSLTEIQLFGRARHSFWRQTAYSALFGLAGGLLASVMIVFFGIPLLEIGIAYVWPLAIMLLLIHPRYLCFAYAGGLVGVFSAVLQLLERYWPAISTGWLSGLADIHIPGLLALIGILHLTESFLIAVSGHLFASPIFLKTNQGVVGGFTLQRFWPLPLVGLLAMTLPEAAAATAGAVPMPEWWPIFASRTVPDAGETLMYLLLPIVAGLGYGDIAVSTTPRRKSRSSSRNLSAYSLLLLAVAFLAFRLPALTILAALFAPLGHELLIMMGNKKEFAGQALYVSPPVGVRVLDIFPRSPAAAAGLVPGDVLLAVNGMPVERQLFYDSLRQAGAGAMINLERDGRHYRLRLDGTGDPGIILVPDHATPLYAEVQHRHFFSLLRERLAPRGNKKEK
ncbi:MAG: PDZ domain-containing protein [Firmicutes bacterium]|nr:PDZ domain-containing protein [Bacillota bacterium]